MIRSCEDGAMMAGKRRCVNAAATSHHPMGTGIHGSSLINPPLLSLSCPAIDSAPMDRAARAGGWQVNARQACNATQHDHCDSTRRAPPQCSPHRICACVIRRIARFRAHVRPPCMRLVNCERTTTRTNGLARGRYARAHSGRRVSPAHSHRNAQWSNHTAPDGRCARRGACAMHVSTMRRRLRRSGVTRHRQPSRDKRITRIE
jgi:hypothetical protein